MHRRAPTLTAFAIGIWAVSALTIPLPQSPGERPTLSLSSLTSRSAIAPPVGLHGLIVGAMVDPRSVPVRAIVGDAEWIPTAFTGWGTLSVVSPLPAATLVSLVPYGRTHGPSASDELLALATELSCARASEAVSLALERTAIFATIDPFDQQQGRLAQPVEGRVEFAFGPERLAHLPTFVRHPGLTYRVPAASSVHAVARGIVRFAGELSGYGSVVVLDHGSAYHTVYGHLAEVLVEVGEVVESREQLGRTGSETVGGQHRLYFELRHFGDPIDPSDWFTDRP